MRWTGSVLLAAAGRRQRLVFSALCAIAVVAAATLLGPRVTSAEAETYVSVGCSTYLSTLTGCNVYDTTPTCPILPFEQWCGPWNVPDDPSNPFAQVYGQCTYWALEKRPDIWKSRSLSDPVSDWDAWTFAEHAEAEGLAVGTTPLVGDLAVWQPGADGAGSAGHVAYVEAVNSDHTVVVSEMNSEYADQGDTRLLSVGEVNQAQFIHLPGVSSAGSSAGSAAGSANTTSAAAGSSGGHPSASHGRSPSLRWLEASRRGSNGFLVRGQLARAASGRTVLVADRGRRRIQASCVRTGTTVRCRLYMPVRGRWQVYLRFIPAAGWSSAQTVTRTLRAR